MPLLPLVPVVKLLPCHRVSRLCFLVTSLLSWTSLPSSKESNLRSQSPENTRITMARSKFKDEHPFEKRKAEAERIRQKYADRIPVRWPPHVVLYPGANILEGHL